MSQGQAGTPYRVQSMRPRSSSVSAGAMDSIPSEVDLDITQGKGNAMVNQLMVANPIILTAVTANKIRPVNKMAPVMATTRMMVTSRALKEMPTMIRSNAEDLIGVHMDVEITEEIDVVVIDRIITIITANKKGAAMVETCPAMMGVQMMVTNQVMTEPQPAVTRTSNAEDHHTDVEITDVVTIEEIGVATTIGNRMSNPNKKRHNNHNDINMI